ncbi:MAG: quinol:electron acceptor oxidoreductase subunit ActD [Acidobacteriota bacterium]
MNPWSFTRAFWIGPSKMSLVAVVSGGIVGIALTAAIYWAQNNYKVITGGMPYFSPWATGVISFEMTMLGAVVSTFGWFLWNRA